MADITTDVMIVGTGAAGSVTAASLSCCGIDSFIIIGRDDEDHTGDWARARNVNDGGCMLMRPDHRVAWRAMSASANAEKDLASALKTLLGH